MNEPRAVKHYLVQTDAYRQVIHMLGKMPYELAAGPLQVLTEGTKAIFVEDPKTPDQTPEPGQRDDLDGNSGEAA
jgi:hypothetical protein